MIADTCTCEQLIHVEGRLAIDSLLHGVDKKVFFVCYRHTIILLSALRARICTYFIGRRTVFLFFRGAVPDLERGVESIDAVF